MDQTKIMTHIDQGYETLQALPPAVKAALLRHMEGAKFRGAAASDASVGRGGAAPLKHRGSGRSVTVQRKRGGWVARCGRKAAG